MSIRDRIAPDLIARAQQGDADAFAAIVTRYQRPLWGYVYQRIADKAAADDIVQQVWVAAWTKWLAPEAPRITAVWLYQTVEYLCLQELRRRRRMPVLSLDVLLDMGYPEPRAPATEYEHAQALLRKGEQRRRAREAQLALLERSVALFQAHAPTPERYVQMESLRGELGRLRA